MGMMQFISHYSELIIFILLLMMMWVCCFIIYITPDEEELYQLSKCVQSGFCCTVRPCVYGKAEGDSPSCVYLTEPTRPYGQRFCSKFKEIQELEKDSKYPMMVSGCSSTLFNKTRDLIIERQNNAHKTNKQT